MVNLTKSLLDAISIIADKTIDEVSSDKTIKAIVKKVVSTSEGKYLVTYNSGDFYAYVQSGSTNLYQVGEQIYILIPEGDMSQKKFIIGKVKDDNDEPTSKKQVNSLLNDYVMIGTNAVIEKEYRVSPLGDSVNVDRMQPLELNSHSAYDFHYCYIHDPDTINDLPEDYDTITNKIIDIEEESFINSAKQAEALLIRANFKASIDTESIGNYGIIVNVAFADKTNPQVDDDNNMVYPPKLVAYVLDTSKMTGNPMKFYDYISQYTISNFDGENYLYIDSIIAFSEGFVDEETESHDEYDDIYIYIDNLEIIALNEISSINGDYKLKLTTPRSNTIKAGYKNELEIAAYTTYFDQDISKNTVFYWGIKDPSITSTSNYYNAKFGSGYKYLNNTNASTLILTHNDLTAAENIFICVAVYESNIILKAFVTLYNNNNNIKITIDSDQGTSFQFNEGSPTLTCLINGKTSDYQKNYPDSAFSFIWSKEDEEFGTVILDKTKKQLEVQKQNELEQCRNNENHLSDTGRSILQILSYYSTQITQIQNISYPNGVHGSKINCKLKNINNYVTYSCSVYRGDVYIGYGSITLQNSKNVINNNYYVTITNGNQVFQYDESGIAPNSQKNQEPIDVLDLIAVFHNPQGIEVTPKKVRWVMPKGKTLINTPSLGLETDPETGEKYFVGNIYPLNIKEIYDNNCNDNQLIAIVTHADGTEYRQSSNLLFTKIGEIGTNGTNIVVKIDELINPPEDERLTIIKSSAGDTFYNSYTSNNELISTDISALEANLYTNNSQTLGYTTKWTIAGTSEIQGYNYKVEGNNSNSCVINYDGIDGELDTRIIKAQTSLNGKYFYGFYGMPAIEYYNGYSYKDYPIKIIKNETLKNILYDSNGTNPSYNENQGIHIELVDWPETGFLEWEVESGFQTNGIYDNPNLLLAKSPKSKTGSRKLEINSNSDNIKAFILTTQDVSSIYADEAPINIKDYINEFVADIEKIGADNILSTSNKLTNLWNRLATFKDEFSDQTNVYIKIVYEKYYELFNKMTEEYNLCKEINKKSAEIYNKIQNIWSSEWPNVITKERLCIINGININSIQELVQLYQQVYDDRSNVENNAVQLPTRDNIFQNIENGVQFLTLLNNMDAYYDTYRIFLGNEAVSLNYILVEYAKILMAYLNIIINETQECFEGTYTYTNAKGQSVNLYNEIKNKYNLAYEDWSAAHNLSTNPASDLASKHVIGKNIYDIIVSAEEISANIYDSIRELYLYYQALYLKIKKYQVAEESETLNSWNAILNGEKVDLLNHIYIIPNDTFNGLYMNNNVVGKVFVKDNDNEIQVAKVYIPIIMTLNTYELAALNGWDGTSIEIGDDHILTPQIGAGIKDDTTNTFTGMVMGAIDNKILDDPSKVNKVGLLGYYNGQQSLFIDSKTGKATFGLPSEDNGTNEGRIELVPGGVSKIGNWKIGSRFLYNIVGGNYEKRADNDSRNSFYRNKWMVPHDKYGIILSADQPYIHIKGETYQDYNLKGINYNDEYNNINPGDSLELRMDSNNKSLFSIVQHTAGFGDEDLEDLFFGYQLSSDLKVKNYITNENIENIENQIGDNIKYYIYRLKTGIDGSYQEYYKTEEVQSNLSRINTWITNSSILSGTKILSSNLTYNNFKQAFNINLNNGMITYNPENLSWTNNNNDDWESDTERISAISLSPVFRYNKINNSPIIQDISIGQLRNNNNNDIYRVRFSGCDISRVLTGMNLNNSNNAYIQFYLVSNNSYNIDNANVLLKSNPINIWNNQTNINVELFSTGTNGYLAKNTTYYLKMYLYIDTYNINAICSSPQITGNYSFYYAPPESQYGTLKITSSNSTNFNIVNGSAGGTLSGYYQYSSGNIRFYVSGNQYDFILWKQQNNSSNNVILGCGRTGSSSNNYSRFFTTTATEWNNLSYYQSITAPSNNNPICITFYPVGTYTTEEIISNTTSSPVSGTNTNGTQENTVNFSYTLITDSHGDTSTNSMTTNTGITNTIGSDKLNNTINENTSTITKYKLINSSVASVITVNEYSDINWGAWNTSNNYNTAQVTWSLDITTNINSVPVLGPVPNSNVDSNTLCVEENTVNTSLQGIPYAETYWETNNNQTVQKIKFYKEYYDWVNRNNQSKTQYGYIDISKDNNNIYYKYIKTLKKASVDNWFANGLNDTSFNHGIKTNEINIYPWISLSTKSNNFQDAIYWKEFIRVGLDENGRFFSAGFQDKKTYSRTGKIYSFGKVPNFYGQEIRVQQNNNRYIPILKIFANSSDLNTTYITQNEKDDGNISIRTSKSTNYVELAASQVSNNETNTIPIRTGYVRISNNNGVQIQHDNKIILTSGDIITTEGKKILLQTANNYANCEFSEPVNIQGQMTGQIKLKSTQYYFGIENNNYPNVLINNNETIFKMDNNTRLYLTSDSSQLKIDDDHSLVINKNNQSGSYFKIRNMALSFSNEDIITLQNKQSDNNIYIKIYNNKIELRGASSTGLDINDKVTVYGTNGILISNGPLIANQKTRLANNIYIPNTTGRFTIGYDEINKTSKEGIIYLYRDDNKNYLKIYGAHLKQLLDWYSEKRWGIAVSGNTVWLKNVKNNNSPEGSLQSSSSYDWQFQTIVTSSYIGQGDS